MHQVILLLSVLFVSTFASVAHAAGAPAQGEVALKVQADRDQPMGWPLVVNVTVTNTGKSPVSWWCGGPDVYPGAEHFVVRVRYGAQSEFQEVSATNGQYVQGSGSGRELKPGESIVVPLAIPVTQPDGVSFTISPREWHAAQPAEGYVTMRDDRHYADRRQAIVIGAVVAKSSPFLQHLAEQYPDAVVLDAMLKLVTVDNAAVAGGAARVLARQKWIPSDTGEGFADLVTRWVPRPPRSEWGGLREDMVEIALETQSESARAAVLKMMAESTDPNTRWLLTNALRLSPGDKAWFRRAMEAINALSSTDGNDAELARQKKRAVEWLESRINKSN